MEPIVIILLLFILFCLFMIYYTSKKKREFIKKQNQLQKDKNSSLFTTLLHYKGLPVAENSITNIFSCSDKYEFLVNGHSFNLKKDKVTDISITNDIDIQKNNISSIGGAIGGAILFGPIGAAIGGRTKEKVSRVLHSYLVFTFLDNSEIKYIAFYCTGSRKANNFIQEFKRNNKKNSINSIEL